MANKSKLSKRYSLSKLAVDWREIIFASLHSDKLKLAIAVISASGCRPSELERGVMVTINDGKIRIGIQGSKVDELTGRGQPLRLLYVDSSTPWGWFLKQKVVGEGGKPLMVNYDAGGISQRLREKSREIWPRRSTLISAYTYRHFIGKSMKESGELPEAIAAALGHASDFSQTAYGRAGGGKKSAGKHGIYKAIAQLPIRHSLKTDRLERLKKSKLIPTIEKL
jgi:integrase